MQPHLTLEPIEHSHKKTATGRFEQYHIFIMTKLRLIFLSYVTMVLLLLELSNCQPIALTDAWTESLIHPTTTATPLGLDFDGNDDTSTANFEISSVTSAEVDSTKFTGHTTDFNVDSILATEIEIARSPIFERLREPYQPQEYNYDFLREI